ncbi:MAG: chromosome partitioning protein [Acidimicrobiales bacterium]|nr:chromosome partitioning protein [Acidimicrobiales bacterium]
MSLVAWVGVKGAHGASTAALAVAGVWPADRSVLLAELDPAGGDIAARFGLGPDPGLVELGAGFHHGLSAEEIWRHVQTLPGGVGVIVAPPSAQQSHALGPLWSRLGPVLAELPGTDVIADLGRLEPGSPALEVAAHAHVVVLVARPTIEGVAHLRARVAATVARARVYIVLVGERPYSAADVEAAAGVPVAGVLADDARAAAMLNGEPGSPAALSRSPLMRSARAVAAALSAISRSTPTPSIRAAGRPVAALTHGGTGS